MTHSGHEPSLSLRLGIDKVTLRPASKDGLRAQIIVNGTLLDHAVDDCRRSCRGNELINRPSISHYRSPRGPPQLGPWGSPAGIGMKPRANGTLGRVSGFLAYYWL